MATANNFRSEPATENSIPVQKTRFHPEAEQPKPRRKRIFDDDDEEGIQPFTGVTPRLANEPPNTNSQALKLTHTTNTPANSSPQQWENRVANAMYGSERNLRQPQNIFPLPVDMGTNQFSKAFNNSSQMTQNVQQPLNLGQPLMSPSGLIHSRGNLQMFQKETSTSSIPHPTEASAIRPSQNQIRSSPYPTTGSPMDIGKLERDLKILREQQASKEKELAELESILGINCQPAVSNTLLTQCIEAHRKVKIQEAELNDLKVNYNMLKEETEKQRNELARLESGEDLDRIPRTRDDLIAQNKLFKEKITHLQQEYEKAVYDKTLEIERTARCEMHKIAMDIAIEHIDAQDHELQDLVAKVRALEAENKRLESSKSLNNSIL